MGLDMYAFSTKAKLKKEVDFDTINVDVEEVSGILKESVQRMVAGQLKVNYNTQNTL